MLIPDGIIHEDNPFTFQTILQASSVVYIDQAIYLRRIRENSIMTAKNGPENVYGYLKSYAYKLGRLLTWPFRKLRTIFKKGLEKQENGNPFSCFFFQRLVSKRQLPIQVFALHCKNFYFCGFFALKKEKSPNAHE